MSARNMEGNELSLTADSKMCTDTEKFAAVYGEKNQVSLRSPLNQKFLSSDKNKPLAFNQNQFTSFQVNKIFDKSHFPRVLKTTFTNIRI